MKQVLTERMEIAFYNVIDHHCDKMEDANVPVDVICKNITDYTEKYISRIEMSDRKKKELRDFIAQICGIYNKKPPT